MGCEQHVNPIAVTARCFLFYFYGEKRMGKNARIHSRMNVEPTGHLLFFMSLPINVLDNKNAV